MVNNQEQTGRTASYRKSLSANTYKGYVEGPDQRNPEGKRDKEMVRSRSTRSVAWKATKLMRKCRSMRPRVDYRTGMKLSGT